MAGFSTTATENLMRELWSKQMKELLLDDLMGTKFVKILTEFPDGSQFNIPSVGEAEHHDYIEGQAVKYDSLDTGNFQFSFDEYKYSAHSMTEKFKRDSFWAPDVLASLPRKQHRSLMEAVETSILSKGPSNQTASDVNAINGADHRWVGSGTSEALKLEDIAKAYYALQMANVPMTNLVAIVDPSVAYTLQTQTNVTNLLSPMPMWEGVVRDGLVTGMRFRFNIYGFDFYVSNYLPKGIAETVDGKSVTVGVANQFFSAAPGDTLPIIGGFRQMPTVFTEFNKDLQQTETLTISEFGFKVYRPENMVVVLTDTDVVA